MTVFVQPFPISGGDMSYLILLMFKMLISPLLLVSPVFMTTSSVNFGFEKAVGLVEVKGTITDETRKDAVKYLAKFKSDKNIQAVILRIDSPGGGVAASQEICNEIRRIKATGKPVYASMGSVAASGGYYIAVPCDKIYANPGTVTGSIGVIMEMPNVEELLKKVGVYFMVIKSEEHKDIGSPFRKMTEEESKLLNDVIDDVYNQFVDAIVAERNLAKEDVLKIADGRILTGKQARELGLIDELGDLQEVIYAAAKAVGIKGKPRVLRPRKKRPTLLEVLGIKALVENYIGSIGLQYR